MNTSAKLLNASEAAAQLGISAKALRLYEQRGLIAPKRSAAGWRAYDAAQMARAAEVVALRELGLGLSDIARALGDDAHAIDPILAAHEIALDARVRKLKRAADRVRHLRAQLARDAETSLPEVDRESASGVRVSFDLPWPWDGERFELRDIGSLNFIVGPLGSGKTRLAMKLADAMPNGRFVGLDRLANGGAIASTQRDDDAALRSRVEYAQAAIVEGGGTTSVALLTLLRELEVDSTAVLVIDVPEQGLDAITQQALMRYLRRRDPAAGAIFLLTRSDAILDLESADADTPIIFCPANHSPPMLVRPECGTVGYEALATCLASPDVRARTEGVIAWRPAKSLVESMAAARSAAVTSL